MPLDGASQAHGAGRRSSTSCRRASRLPKHPQCPWQWQQLQQQQPPGRISAPWQPALAQLPLVSPCTHCTQATACMHCAAACCASLPTYRPHTGPWPMPGVWAHAWRLHDVERAWPHNHRLTPCHAMHGAVRRRSSWHVAAGHAPRAPHLRGRPAAHLQRGLHLHLLQPRAGSHWWQHRGTRWVTKWHTRCREGCVWEGASCTHAHAADAGGRG